VALIGKIVVDIFAGPCPSDDCPVTVIPPGIGYCPTDTTLQIEGTCFEFDPDCSGNEIVLQDSSNADIPFSIFSCTATELILTVDLSSVPLGPIKASVANANGNSGGLVQVGTLLDCSPCSPTTTLLASAHGSGEENGTFTLAAVTVPVGMLVVVIAFLEAQDQPKVTFNGIELVPAAPTSSLDGVGGAKEGMLSMRYGFIPPAEAGTFDIVCDASPITGEFAVAAFSIVGLKSGDLQDYPSTTAAAHGELTNDLICPIGETTVPCEVAIQAWWMRGTYTPTEAGTPLATSLISMNYLADIGPRDYTLHVAWAFLPNIGDIVHPRIVLDSNTLEWVGISQGFY
jgi:hypothetical protein